MHFAWTCQATFPPRYCRCTAKALKTLILLKDEVKEMDTLHVFEAQLKKNDIQLKEKNKNYQWQEWVNSIIFTSVTLEV